MTSIFCFTAKRGSLPEDLHGLLVAVDEIEDLRNGGQSQEQG